MHQLVLQFQAPTLAAQASKGQRVQAMMAQKVVWGRHRSPFREPTLARLPATSYQGGEKGGMWL